jgi:trehalose synthase
VNENFGRFTHLDHDCVIIHDPQPLPLISVYTKRQPWIWRCHIDLSDPQPDLWEYLKDFLIKYDQIVVSDESYFKPDLPVEQRLMRPAINPLTEKNRDLPEATVAKVLDDVGVPRDKPLVTQVSRLDPWKDPEGLLDVFMLVKKQIDCRLVFCYNVASDDPEALRMYDRVYKKARKAAKPDEVIFVVGNKDTLVNALQRASDVIVQKSTREGFCLAVTEALWKGKPVVGSRVGGIPSQIQDGETGFLIDRDDLEGFAERIVYLLEHPKEGEAIGEQAREMAREKFLIPRLLSDYLDMLNAMIGNHVA